MTASPDPIAEWTKAAQAAASAGRHDEALTLWSRVAEATPGHGAANHFLGWHALRNAKPDAALNHFTTASRALPREAMIHLGLAMAARALGDAARELTALDAALECDPFFYRAWIEKGQSLERLGHHRAAARTYKDALKVKPPEAQLTPDLRAATERARRLVASYNKAYGQFLSQRLSAARARHRDAKLARFDECLAIASGEGKVYTQHPTNLHYPGLPAIAFYDNDDFPWTRDLEAATKPIREDLARLIAADRPDFAPYVAHPAGAPAAQWADLNHSPRWSAYFFWRDGKRRNSECDRCPATAAILDQMPLGDVPGFAPSAFYSCLDPDTHIPPHTGVTNARLIVHLGLVIPPGCGFRVGNETREWREGGAWIFDDTIEHEAWNRGDRLRVILIFDIWNPHLSEAERDLVVEMLTATREFLRAEGPSGA